MDNNNLASCDESQICNFYKDKTLFLTGGTGFMGKILIEKLLRTTDIAMVYLLIREKRGKNIHVRMDELLDNIIFQRLKVERPQFKHRITPISGDISSSGLGINIDDRIIIMNKTNIVIHLAATVRFDVNLKRAYNINCKSTHEIVNLCKEMPNLKSAVYVSTAYSNCHMDNISEMIYENPVDYLKLEEAMSKLNENEIDRITPSIISNWPNTYTFTKSLAENVIRTQFKDLPIGIYRPAIVVSTYKEPIEAWVDNFYGPTGVVAGTTSGLIRTMLVADIPANMVPVDMCISGLIAATWDISKQGCVSKEEDIQVYNYVSCTDNPLRWHEFCQLNYLFYRNNPFSKAIWTPITFLTSNIYLYCLYKILLHYLPALFMDIGLTLMLKKPRALMEYRKIHKLMSVIEYFSMKDIKFSNDNLKRLWSKMNMNDRNLFPMNITDLCWMDYLKNYNKGICLYLLKDDAKNIKEARRRTKFLKILHYCCKHLLIYIVINFIWTSFVSLIRW